MKTVAAAILLIFAASMPSAVRAEAKRYVFYGLDEITQPDRDEEYKKFFFSQTSVLELDISDGKATGTLYPKFREPIKVEGKNPRNGKLKLTFHGKKKDITIDFEKSAEYGSNIHWGDELTGATFSRPLDGSVSDSAFVLSSYECGARYGDLEIYARKNVTAEQLKSDLSASTVLTNVVTRDHPDDPSAATKEVPLITEMVSEFSKGHLTDPEHQSLFSVPVGSEVAVVTALRASPSILYADMNRGGCGGADRSFVIVPRSALFANGKFSEEKFSAFVDEAIKRIVSVLPDGSATEFRLENPKKTKIKVEPYSTSIRYKAVVASEITRATPNYWDRFYINFEPAETSENTPDTYTVVVYVENWSQLRRSKGATTPPDDNWFTDPVESYETEAIVTEAISASMVEKKYATRCTFEMEGYDGPKAKIPRC